MRPEPIVDGWTLFGLMLIAFGAGAMVGAALVRT
jgi:hypothetical protein